MIEAYGQALGFLFQPTTLGLIFVAILVGLVIGILPGIGGLVGISILLPFLFRMPAEVALSFLIAFHAATPTSGSITAILINVPGTASNIATTIDGFPMNQKGQGARAIGAAVTASAFGGFVPCFFALAMIPLLTPIVMNFKSPEMVMLVLLGIVFMGSFTEHGVSKGVMSGILGLLLALVGQELVTGVHRFTFGTVFLVDGLGLIEVSLGVFGVAEMFDLLTKRQAALSVGRMERKLSHVFEGAKDVFRHKWLWLRSTVIGYIVGVIPAIGAATAVLVAYAQAKQISKTPEKFGTGCVEGVIAPESANNAVASGDLLTTMVLGIPGGPFMALFLGAFVMVGVVPGPRMMVENLPLGLTLLLGLALANIIAAAVCFFGAPYLARVASVHIDFVFPVTLALIFAGSFLARGATPSMIETIIFGICGFMMKRFGFSRPAFILGFVMGDLLENYVLLSLQVAGPLFFLSPISMGLLSTIIIVLTLPLWRKGFARLRSFRGFKGA